MSAGGRADGWALASDGWETAIHLLQHPGMYSAKRAARPLAFALLVLNAGSAAERDAVAISRNIQARHFPHYTVLDPVFDSRSGSRIVSYSRCGDSALWTGAYLAAEAFRYKVTRAGEALENARRAVAGIQSLTDVTGNNVLARCLIPNDSPYASAIASEEAANGIYRSGPENFWVGNTSRDQYTGVIFGLGVAFELIDDQPLKTSAAALVTRLVRFLRDHNWSVELPDGRISTSFLIRPEQRLAFLQLARRVNPDQFSTAYDISRVLLSGSVIAPISVDVLSDDSYFKFNLDTMNLYTLITLESSDFRVIYRKAYDVLRNHTDDHANAFFNMVDFAINGPNPARDAESRALLDQWLLRVRRDPYLDHTGKYPSCGDPAKACQPLPIIDRAHTDFIWQRSPFQLAGGAHGTIETAGIDYILPYWMGRYYGVIQPDNIRVTSATGGVERLAPESIGAIFGSNLAASTRAAGTQPPPEVLDGLTLTTRDLDGIYRPARIYYISPGQINFYVPPGVRPGTVSIAVQRPGAADVITSTEIFPVAPALFTASATGTGPPAATAMRVATGQQVPVPVFSCSAAGCAAVPIDVGPGAATYLSLYGTGIRNRSSLTNVVCTIGGISAPVLYAGPQIEFSGLDQVNVALPVSLRNLAETDLVLTVDGQPSNPVRVHIR